MTIEESFVTLLRDDTGVGAIIGTGDAAKIYAMTVPDDVPLPLIVFQRISGVLDTTMDPSSGPVTARIQVSSYASDYSTAKTLGTAVRNVLHGYTGGLIQFSFEVSQGDIVDTSAEAESAVIFGFRSDFQVFANEG